MNCSKVLNKQAVRGLISNWLNNESQFNFICCALKDDLNQAKLSIRGPAVLAGQPFVNALYQELNCSITWLKNDGDLIPAGVTDIAVLSGPIDELVHGERLATILLSKATGIASFAQKLKKCVSDMAWKGVLTGPRVMTPGFNLLEEYALMVGGIPPSKTITSVVLRQTHIEASKDIKTAINEIRSQVDLSVKIAVQCSTITEAKAASDAGANIVLYENLLPKDMSMLVAQLKNFNHNIEIEVNNTLNEGTIRPLLNPNVKYLSAENISNNSNFISFHFKYCKGSPEVKQDQSERTQNSQICSNASKRPREETVEEKKPNDGPTPPKQNGSSAAPVEVEIKKSPEKPQTKEIKTSTIKKTEVKSSPMTQGNSSKPSYVANKKQVLQNQNQQKQKQSGNQRVRGGQNSNGPRALINQGGNQQNQNQFMRQQVNQQQQMPMGNNRMSGMQNMNGLGPGGQMNGMVGNALLSTSGCGIPSMGNNFRMPNQQQNGQFQAANFPQRDGGNRMNNQNWNGAANQLLPGPGQIRIPIRGVNMGMMQGRF